MNEKKTPTSFFTSPNIAPNGELSNGWSMKFRDNNDEFERYVSAIEEKSEELTQRQSSPKFGNDH